MSKPNIQIENVRVMSGAVVEATVAGYPVKLMLPDTFVEDEIGGADDASVQAYFAITTATSGQQPGRRRMSIPRAAKRRTPA